jgi:DNA-binding CsgD family transcriptional regulator
MAEPRGQPNYHPRSVDAAAEAVLDARGEALKLKRVFHVSRVPMVLVDAEWRHVVNRPARLTLGLSLGELRALATNDLTRTHLARDMEQARARLLDTGRVSGHHQLARRDGSHLDIVYRGLAHVLPGVHLIAFAPAGWPEDDGPQPVPSLTRREAELLALAADGHSGLQLAEKLVLSPATIKTHFKNIYKKLEAQNRAAAVAKAMRLGMID